jgi:hypothetical protein
MPAISVRDIQVKDDSSCFCADLVAGTHGRGFWILDNLTPLRQAAAIEAAQRSGAPYLVKPATALRVRFGTNDPTPWPPEVPAGENPPPGGILDYYLPSDAAGAVTLEVLDAAGKVVRSYSSTDPHLDPDPALDPAAYDQVCRRRPTATHCGLPLYWPAPELRIGTRAGMHRVWWDLRYQPFPVADVNSAGNVMATGAVPRRSYPAGAAPWAAPGSYTVRLTANGKTATQPLTLRLDPRVRTPALALAQLASLSRGAYDAAIATRAAYTQARGLSGKLARESGEDLAAFKAALDSLAPAAPTGGGGGGGGGGFGGGQQGTAARTLLSASNVLMAAAMAMQGADVAPTAGQVTAVQRTRAQAAEVMGRWNALKTVRLAALNARRRAGGLPELLIP